MLTRNEPNEQVDVGYLNDYPNGLIMLKGGFLDLEIAPFKEILYKFPITEWLPEQWFVDKYLLYLPMDK